DFCPVCGLDQRHRFARPATQIVRIDPEGMPVPTTPTPPTGQLDALAQPGPATGGVPGTPPGGSWSGPGSPESAHAQPGFAPAPVAQHPPAPAVPGAAPLGASAQPPAQPPAKTGRTVFMDGPPLARPPELGGPVPPVQSGPSEDALTVPAPGRARLDSGIPVGGGYAPPAVELEAPVEHPASGSTARSEGGAPQSPAMLPPDMDELQTRATTLTGPRLVLVGRDGEEGQAFPFTGSTITIGRQHGEIAFADDPFMSPQHARVERSGELFTLVDLGSTNGIYLRTRGNASVYPGDLFMVGHQVLRLENISEPVAEQHPAPDGTRLFGTPLKPAWGRLGLIGRGGITGDTFYLRGAKVIFGREQGDILFPRDPFASREHAQLRLELHGAQMSVFLEDLGSANGTYIRIRGSAEVRNGDTFRVGDQILRLRLDD
ncbi:MAG: FHA domain-containing protein, partial [Nannocystales bacterium]